MKIRYCLGLLLSTSHLCAMEHANEKVLIPSQDDKNDAYVYEYVKSNIKARMALIWPRAIAKAEGIKKILAHCGPLIYEKKFALFPCGPTHIFLVAHPTWAEDVALMKS